MCSHERKCRTTPPTTHRRAGFDPQESRHYRLPVVLPLSDFQTTPRGTRTRCGPYSKALRASRKPRLSSNNGAVRGNPDRPSGAYPSPRQPSQSFYSAYFVGLFGGKVFGVQFSCDIDDDSGFCCSRRRWAATRRPRGLLQSRPRVSIASSCAYCPPYPWRVRSRPTSSRTKPIVSS